MSMCPEHMLLFLCAHGAKHYWARLGWICDIARLLQVETELDWDYVLAQAGAQRASRMLFLGLLLASDLLRVEIPKAVALLARAETPARSLAATIVEHILMNSAALDSTLFSSRAFERTAQRVRFFVGVYIAPTEAEYRALQLPPALHLLYYAFRPLRLIAKHARRGTGFSSNDAAKMIQ